MYLLLLLPLLSTQESATCQKKPILLIPGIMATMLETKVHVPQRPFLTCPKDLNWTVTWVSWSDLVLSKCYLHYMTPIWDASTNRTYDQGGVSVRVPEPGSVYAIDTLTDDLLIKPFVRVYHNFIKHLQKLGYQDRKDMIGGGFDWRFSEFNEPEGYFNKLKNLIENTFIINNNRKIVVVTHSMGGMYFYKFLDHVGKDFTEKYIDIWVTLSAPFLGTGFVMKFLLEGDNMGIFVVDKKLVRDACQNMEALYMMLPYELGFKDQVVFRAFDGKEYTAGMMSELLKAAGLPEFGEVVYRNSWWSVLERHQFRPPFGVQAVCVYSKGIDTVLTSIQLEDKKKDFKVGYLYGQGDGEVNLESLRFCEEWSKEVVVFEKILHNDVVRDDRVFEVVKRFIC